MKPTIAHDHRTCREAANRIRTATTLDPPTVHRPSRAVRHWSHSRGDKRRINGADGVWRREESVEGRRRFDGVHLPQSRPRAPREFSRTVLVQWEAHVAWRECREFL